MLQLKGFGLSDYRDGFSKGLLKEGGRIYVKKKGISRRYNIVSRLYLKDGGETITAGRALNGCDSWNSYT